MYNGKTNFLRLSHYSFYRGGKKCLFIYKYSFMTYGGLGFSFACLNATVVGFIEGEVIGI